MDENDGDDNRPTETSPLLERQGLESNDEHGELPYLLEVEHDLYAERDGLPLVTSPKAIEDVVQACSLPSQELIHALTLVLCIRRISGSFLDSHRAIPPWALTPAPEIEEYVVLLWDRMSMETSDEDLSKILWTTFVLSKLEMYPKSISVIQTLLFDSPTPIALDIRLSKILVDVWRRGGTHTEYAILAASKLANTTSLFAPRVLHIMDLSFFLLFIGIASSYALEPARYGSNRSVNSADPRSVALLVYSVSRLSTTQWKQNIHFVLMAFSIALSDNLSPGMNDNTYILFLLSLSFHIIQLQLPLHPSPIFLFPSLRSLPISCIFHTIITQIFIPALLFFLPILLLISFLLSLSLSDVFVLPLSRVAIAPAPENARFAFVMLGSLALALFSCLITCMVLASPTVATSRRAVLTWDAYGTKVGLATRQTFHDAVHHYSRPYFFPAPLNLLEVLFVSIPCTLFRVFKREKLASRVEYALKRVLWTCVVYPLAVCFASIWLWGLLL